MDISYFDTRDRAAEGIEWTLKYSNKKEVLGSDGEPVKFMTKGVDAAKERGRIAKLKAVSEVADYEAYGQSLMEADAEYLAGFLIGWTDNFSLKGKPMPFNKANAIEVMSIPHIASQQQEVLLERSNFMNKASD